MQPNLTFSGNNNWVDGFTYDAAGNLLNDERNSYTYDAEGRIVRLNGNPTYAYDAEGHRVAKLGSGGSVTDRYLLSLGREQVTELNSSNQWVHSNVSTGGRLLATYEGPAGPAPNTYHFHLMDWLGTHRVQAAGAGNQEEICYSYPFGDGLNCTGTDAVEHHFTGKERDTESGLDYFGARYLNSNLGRFMTPDWAAAPTAVPYASFGDPQSLNLYAYAENSPSMRIDLDGHDEMGNGSGSTDGPEWEAAEEEAEEGQTADSGGPATADSSKPYWWMPDADLNISRYQMPGPFPSRGLRNKSPIETLSSVMETSLDPPWWRELEIRQIGPQKWHMMKARCLRVMSTMCCRTPGRLSQAVSGPLDLVHRRRRARLPVFSAGKVTT